MKRIVIFSILCLLSWTSKADELVFVGQDYPPYQWQEKNTIHGLFPEIIAEVCHKIKLTCHFKMAPFKRALREIETGQDDGMMSVIKKSERENFALFTQPVTRSVKSYFGIKANVGELKTLQDIHHTTVGVVRESSSSKLAHLHQEQVSSLTISEQNDNSTILRMIAANRFGYKGLILGNRDVIQYLIKKEAYTTIEELFPIESEQYCIAFSKKKVSLSLFEKFNTAFNELKQTKSLQAIYQKYGVTEIH